jgi:hypothetical protein
MPCAIVAANAVHGDARLYQRPVEGESTCSMNQNYCGTTLAVAGQVQAAAAYVDHSPNRSGIRRAFAGLSHPGDEAQKESREQPGQWNSKPPALSGFGTVLNPIRALLQLYKRHETRAL